MRGIRIRRFADVDGVKVWAVNGKLVRDRFNSDFSQGGHGYVYPWIPKGEIWIDEVLSLDEVPYVVEHERFERKLMKERGLSYDEAHELAKAREDWMRARKALGVVKRAPGRRRVSSSFAISVPIFYRGTEPGRTERIVTGAEAWDSYLFVTDTPEGARWYGSQVEEVELAPDARVLYEGTAEFRKVAGTWRKGESLLAFASRAAKAAQVAGYHAVHFKSQTDVGTAILDRSKVVRREVHGGGFTGWRSGK